MSQELGGNKAFRLARTQGETRLWFRVYGFEVKGVGGLGFRGLGFSISGLRVKGLGFRALGFVRGLGLSEDFGALRVHMRIRRL